MVSLLSAALPFLFKLVIDRIAVPGLPAESNARTALVYYCATLFVVGVMRQMWTPLFTVASLRIQRHLSLSTLDHLLKLPMAFYLEPRKHALGHVLARAKFAGHRILLSLTETFFPTLFQLVFALIVVTVLFDYKVVATLVLAAIVFCLGTLAGSEYVQRFQRRFADHSSRNAEIIGEIAGNLETVKLFGVGDTMRSRYRRGLSSAETESLRYFTLASAIGVFQIACVAAGLLPALLLSLKALEEGHITIGSFVLLNMYVSQMMFPLQALGFAYRELKESVIDLDLLQRTIYDVPVEEDENLGRLPSRKARSIAFRQVWFNYPGSSRPALRNVTFSVASGQTIGIVGPTGSGKSSIVRLLLRYYDPDAGEIRLDGENIATLSLDTLRSEIGLVPQDVVLFNDTLMFNVACGTADSDLPIAEVIRRVQLEKLHQAEELEVLVGDRGLALSGGERQRVGIARVLVRDPPVLVFDEATSSLDSKTEAAVQRNILEISQGKTTLIISHRLFSVRRANCILVLSDGAIVEQGTHEQLMANDGLYADMYSQQVCATTERAGVRPQVPGR